MRKKSVDFAFPMFCKPDSHSIDVKKLENLQEQIKFAPRIYKSFCENLVAGVVVSDNFMEDDEIEY